MPTRYDRRKNSIDTTHVQKQMLASTNFQNSHHTPPSPLPAFPHANASERPPHKADHACVLFYLLTSTGRCYSPPPKAWRCCPPQILQKNKKKTAHTYRLFSNFQLGAITTAIRSVPFIVLRFQDKSPPPPVRQIAPRPFISSMKLSYSWFTPAFFSAGSFAGAGATFGAAGRRDVAVAGRGTEAGAAAAALHAEKTESQARVGREGRGGVGVAG